MKSFWLSVAWFRKWGTWLLVGLLSIVLFVVGLLLRAARKREAEQKMRDELSRWKAGASVAYGNALRDALQSEVDDLGKKDKALTDQIAALPAQEPVQPSNGMSAEQVAEELKRRGY